MAESSDKSENSNEMNEESKAILNEMMELGENWCVSEDIVNQSNAKDNDGIVKVLLTGTLKNLTKEPLQLFDHKLWEGHIIRLYPNPLTSSIVGHFVHKNPTLKGIEAAVVYTGKNCQGDLCGWLLAWSDCNGKLKVYADCGRETKFKNINWELIKVKLHDSKSKTANIHDKETGTTLVAKLHGNGGIDYLTAAFFSLIKRAYSSALCTRY